MNRFKFSNYKLPHMAPFNNNKVESPKIKNPKTAQEEEMAKAKEEFRRISQKPLLEPKPLHPNSVAKQTVSSSGGNDLDEFLKRVESRKIKNPEYADVEGPEYSKSYDFFITNRNEESDKVARQMDSLNKAVKSQAKNRQFDEMRKTREYQQNLMNQYNLD